MNKKIGLLSASLLGLTSIIGSGWLFASYRAAQVAGQAAIFSWIIGMLAIALLAFCLIEVVSRYPIRGLSAVIPFLTHNKHFGFPFAIANWLGIVAVIGLEAEAVVQYVIQLIPQWNNILFFNGQLTPSGEFLTIILVILFTLVNFWGARMMTRVNNILSILKIIIPIIVALALIATAFHPNRFTFNHNFIPYGFGSIFTAILSTGIIIAFNGFQTVASFASEVEKPEKTIGWSIVIALVMSLGIYELLQIAFIGSMPSSIAAQGWAKIKMEAPILQLVGLLGLGMFSSMIYFGSVIAPAGTGIAFVGAATRMFTAMSRKGQMPGYFNAVHTIYNVSRRSLILNMVLAIIFVLTFRSWSSLAQILSIFHILSYLPIMLAIWVLRKQFPRDTTKYRLPFGKLISLLLFIFFVCLFMQAKWPLVRDTLLIFLTFQIIYILFNVKSMKDTWLAITNSSGLFIFFLGVAIIVWGHNLIQQSYIAGNLYVPLCITWASLGFFILYFQANTKKIPELTHGR